MNADALLRACSSCGHPPRWVSFGGLVWVLGCGSACKGGEPCVAVAFALGRKEEIPRALLTRGCMPEARGALARLFASGPRLGPATVRRCLPREHVDLAHMLGVDEWRRGVLASGEGIACGFSLGMPVCAIAPYEGAARRFADAGKIGA